MVSEIILQPFALVCVGVGLVVSLLVWYSDDPEISVNSEVA